jgi:serine/threonine-protein kinase
MLIRRMPHHGGLVEEHRVEPPPLPVGASRDGGRYTLRSLLGRGGMGEVYLAYDERLLRRVAIKRIRSAQSGAEHLSARLEQEARLLAQLGHPAIVQVFDIFEDEDGAWVVMELVEGRSLAAVLREEPVGVGDALSHGVAITAALDAAHRQGIIHRDLKVENVMLSTSGQIKVLDFGLAKRLLPTESGPGLSVEGQVLGTVRTMSPEQARGLATDERSDLFSLGVLLYELLSGSSPFAGATALDTLVRLSTHRQTSLIDLPGMAERIPPALSELVDELLEKAVEQRPSSAAEVRARLEAIAEVHLRPRPAPAPPGRQAEPLRRRWAALDQQATDVPTAAAGPLAQRSRAALGEQPAAVAVAALASPEPPRVRERPAGTPATGMPVVELAPGAPPLEGSLEPRRPRARRRLVLLAGLGAAVAIPAAILMLRVGGELAPAQERAPPAGSASNLDPGPTAAAAPPRDPRAEYERGMDLLRDFHRRGALDEAAGIFQRLLRQDDRSAAAYAGLARANWLRYKVIDAGSDPVFLQHARTHADRAVALDELLADARVSRGLVALELGQPEQAEKDFQAALALDGKSADAHYGMARLHRKRQRAAEAEAAYRKALALTPGDRRLHDDLGGLLVEAGRYAAAIPLFEKSIALAPDSPYGYSNLGSVYLALGRYEEAAQRFQDALKIQPSSSLYTNLGNVLFTQGLYGPAATAFERALAMGGAAHDPLRWANLADAYRQLPDSVGKAREHYDHAIELVDGQLARTPQDPTLLSRRALYLAKRGDCPRADAGLALLLDAREPPLYAMFRMAVALELCEHRGRAIAMIERSLARGFPPAEIEGDPELRALRADPAYLLMIQRRGKAAVRTESPSR